jgi:acetyl esterase/lipase
VSWFWLFAGTISFLLAVNALRPRYAPARLAIVSFFAGWLTAELGFHALFCQGLLLAGCVWTGGYATWPGLLGLGLSVASVLLLLVAWRRSAASRHVVAAGLLDFDHDETPTALHWRRLALPIPVRHAEVERLRDITYFEEGHLRLRLDVFRRRGDEYPPGARKPVLLFVHGGAWVIGNKEHQGLPLMHQFAARGWVCFSINYRLSPRATFPDHIIDVKRAIAWVRTHAAEYGGDGDFIVISGASAGGHLASLAALSPGVTAFQPGFEAEDTSVQGCVSFYGIYDFTDQLGHWPNPGLQRLLERYVIKASLRDAAERYAQASPVTYLGPHAPPFLIVHGECDSLVPAAEGRAFAAALSAVSEAACVYLEIPGAQHAFEVFPSLRSHHVLGGVERFAAHIHRQHRLRSASPSTDSPTQSA